MSTHRVIFVDPELWTNRKENTMTDKSQTDFKADVRAYWNQLRAVDLCRAVDRGDDTAADSVVAEADTDNEILHLIAGLVWAAGSLVKTVAAQHPTATETAVWAALTERSSTGLHATRELSQLLDNIEGENNA